MIVTHIALEGRPIPQDTAHHAATINALHIERRWTPSQTEVALGVTNRAGDAEGVVIDYRYEAVSIVARECATTVETA